MNGTSRALAARDVEQVRGAARLRLWEAAACRVVLTERTSRRLIE